MANVQKNNGFQPITSGGTEVRRQQRATMAASANSLMAPGDAYAIDATGYIIRQTATNVAVNGIMESVALPGSAIGEGPTSYSYVPASTSLNIIGIEDFNTEFVVTSDTALPFSSYDTNAEVDIVDVAPDTVLGISRQSIGIIGDQFRLVRALDQVNNDPYAQYAKVVVRLKPASIV